MDTHSTLSNVIIVAVGYLIIIVLWPKLCKVKGVYEPPDIPPPLKLHPHIPSTPLQPIKPPPLMRFNGDTKILNFA